MIKEIFNLMILNAFKVDASDVVYPIYQRLPGKRLALLNWGPAAIKISFATKTPTGMEIAPEELYLPVTTPMPQVIENLKQRTDCDCVAVLYSAVSMFCEAQSGPKTEPGEMLEKRLRGEAKGLIGSAFEEDKTYQMLLAPDKQTRILFAVAKAAYRELEKALSEGGLTIVRSQIAPYALMNALLADESWKTPAEDAIVLATVVSQAHVIVCEFAAERFSPEIFRATPLFLAGGSNDSPEFIEQLRNFFINCAEGAMVSKRVFGKRVIFRWVSAGNPNEAALDLGSYLPDRSDIEFEKWKGAQLNIDFKALVDN